MALKEMYKNEIEPHNLFCVDNSRILIYTHIHTFVYTYTTMSLQLGNERHDILVVGIKQAAIYVLYMVNLKLPSNVLNHILLLL